MLNKTQSENIKEQTSSRVRIILKNIPASQEPVAKKNIRTTEYKKMIEICLTDPDSITHEEFIAFQSAIGYGQTVKLLEDGKRRKRLGKGEKLDASTKTPFAKGKRQVQLKKEGGNYIDLRDNKNGIPNNLKSGLEKLSRINLSDLSVHTNSDKPKQVDALAYTQGNNIHIAPRQDKHLPHEGWHAVQQKQGRVAPTLQMKTGALVNDDAGLEKEADIMGGKAIANLGVIQKTDLASVTKKSGEEPIQLKKKDKTDKEDILEKTEVVSIVMSGSKSKIWSLFKEHIVAGKTVLGSYSHIKKIGEIYRKDGAKSAFNKIKEDVEKNSRQLDDYTSVNIKNFYTLVEVIVEKNLVVDDTMHYFRNKLNRYPATIDELIRENKALEHKDRWKMLKVESSYYHMQKFEDENGETVDGLLNTKFVSGDGHLEAVYDKDGKVVTDSINMGTFNYAPSTTTGSGNHLIFDVKPYYDFGNTDTSKQKGINIELERHKTKKRVNKLKNIKSVLGHRTNIIKKGGKDDKGEYYIKEI